MNQSLNNKGEVIKVKKKLLILGLSLVLVIGIGSLVAAQDLTGDDVLDNVEESISADTSQMEFDMVLHSDDGRTRERELIVKRMETDDGVDQGFIRFLAPPSVEGTGFLSHDYGDDDDMYLFMPAVGSVRRIASGQRDGSFVGTDFTYNDLSLIGGENYQDDYEATIIEETEDEYILEMVPTDDDIHYDFGEMRVQKSNWFPVEIELYEDGELTKRLTNKDIVQVDGYWTAREITMADLVDGTKTVLHMNEIVYDEPIEEQIFTTRYLERY